METQNRAWHVPATFLLSYFQYMWRTHQHTKRPSNQTSLDILISQWLTGHIAHITDTTLFFLPPTIDLPRHTFTHYFTDMPSDWFMPAIRRESAGNSSDAVSNPTVSLWPAFSMPGVWHFQAVHRSKAPCVGWYVDRARHYTGRGGETTEIYKWRYLEICWSV